MTDVTCPELSDAQKRVLQAWHDGAKTSQDVRNATGFDTHMLPLINAGLKALFDGWGLSYQEMAAVAHRAGKLD